MLPILERAARSAGKLILSYFQKETHATHKTSHQNLVTVADTGSQTLIKNYITDALIALGIPKSEIGFIGEENLETKGTNHLFIIDPIDGTNSFASGLDYFCISIAHVIDGKAAEGIVYWPSRDILYYAQAGKGAYKKIKGHSPIPLKVQDELLENSMVFTNLSSRKERRKMIYSYLEKIYDVTRGVRINGSSCLDLVHLCDKENAVHITIYFHSYVWDVAASSLIVIESGGILCDLKGNKLQIHYTDSKSEYAFIAAHPNVIEKLKKYI